MKLDLRGLTGLVILLAGCGATPQLPDRLQPWVGRTGAELRAAYAAEPSVYMLDERTELLTWSDSSFMMVDPLSGVSSSTQTPQVRTSTTQRCTVTFTVVEDWAWRGNNRTLCPVRDPPGSTQASNP